MRPVFHLSVLSYRCFVLNGTVWFYNAVKCPFDADGMTGAVQSELVVNCLLRCIFPCYLEFLR